MRAILFCLATLLMASTDSASAQMKLSPKAASSSETRYFTSIEGMMGGNADVILKEMRQGKTVTTAVLDVCYPANGKSARKDRFVANLSVDGQTLTGSTQTLTGKQPVTIKLSRKPTDDTFEFRGQITIGSTVTEVVSSDNYDISEREFQDTQTTGDTINPAPKDFTEVSPEAIGVRVKLDEATDLLKSLKGQPVEVSLASLPITCEALRAGEQTINLSVDPERSAELIAKLKSMPGVVAAGWTTGIVEIDRAIRFPAAEWRDGGRLNKDKLAGAISGVLSRTLAATPASASWDPATGQLRLTFKRPNQLYAELGLTDTIEVTGLVSTDKPGASDRLMLWIGSPSTTTADEASGAKLNLSDESSNEEEGEQLDDNGSIDALVKELTGERWDADKSVWK
jgi:hypothetical protein